MAEASGDYQKTLQMKAAEIAGWFGGSSEARICAAFGTLCCVDALSPASCGCRSATQSLCGQCRSIIDVLAAIGRCVIMNRLRLTAIGVSIAAVSLFAAACSSSTSTETTAASSSPSVSNVVVEELQTTLTTLEYYTGPIDGIYGPATTEAVESFQKDAGVTVDGKYGPETHAALEKAYIEISNAWEDHKAVTELQQAMSDLGYYEGTVDGLYGPETVAGIKAVQKDCGLAEDGLYGPETHACLVDLGGDA